jgi:hypothetical protein
MRALHCLRVAAVLIVIAKSSSAQAPNGYPDDPKQQYIQDRDSLSLRYSDLQLATHFDCHHWSVWYFAQGEARIEGKQWGVDEANSAEAVLAKQKAGVEFDRLYARFMHVSYPTDKFVHDNYIGPICVLREGMTSTPDVLRGIEAVGAIAAGSENFIKTARTIMEAVENGKTGGGYAYLFADRTPLEEFLKNVSDIPKQLNKTRRILMLGVAAPMNEFVSVMYKLAAEYNSAAKFAATIHPIGPAPRIHDDRCLLIANRTTPINCDAHNACDLETFTASCDANGVYTEQTCVVDHVTHAKTCN